MFTHSSSTQVRISLVRIDADAVRPYNSSQKRPMLHPCKKRGVCPNNSLDKRSFQRDKTVILRKSTASVRKLSKSARNSSRRALNVGRLSVHRVRELDQILFFQVPDFGWG